MSLPRFEGRTPDSQRITASFSIVVPAELQEAHKIGDKIPVCGLAEVLHVDHKPGGQNGKNLIRLEATTIRDIAFIPWADANTLIDQHALRPAPDDDQETLDI